MTKGFAVAQGTPRPQLQISIMHVPECPLVARLRAEVETALEHIGARAVIDEIEGPYPSPTLLINGVELDGHPMGSEPACRIDLPTRGQVTSAIRTASIKGIHRSLTGERSR